MIMKVSYLIELLQESLQEEGDQEVVIRITNEYGYHFYNVSDNYVMASPDKCADNVIIDTSKLVCSTTDYFNKDVYFCDNVGNLIGNLNKNNKNNG